MVVLGRGVMLVNVVRFDMVTTRQRIQEQKKRIYRNRRERKSRGARQRAMAGRR